MTLQSNSDAFFIPPSAFADRLDPAGPLAAIGPRHRTHKKPRGRWESWGTSLCWWAKVFGDRDDLADLLFTHKTVELADEKLPGLGLNIVRYNLGACSCSLTIPLQKPPLARKWKRLRRCRAGLHSHGVSADGVWLTVSR